MQNIFRLCKFFSATALTQSVVVVGSRHIRRMFRPTEPIKPLFNQIGRDQSLTS